MHPESIPVKLKSIFRIQASSILFTFFFIITAGSLSAHTVTLKNGKVIVGKIVNQTKEEIHIEVNQVLKVIPKTEVSEVDFSSPAEEPKKEIAPKEEPRIIKKPEKKPEVKPEDTPKEKPARPLGPVDLIWRSAVLPGWGQHKVNEKLYAYTEGPFTFLAFFYAYNARSSALKEKANYENTVMQSFVILQGAALAAANPPNPVETLVKQFFLGVGAFNKYQEQVDKFNFAVQFLGVVYLGQIGHSWYLGKKNKSSETPLTVFHFGILPSASEDGKAGMNSFAAFSFRF